MLAMRHPVAVRAKIMPKGGSPSDAWYEDLIVEYPPEKGTQEMVDRFNDTLLSGERPRALVSVRVRAKRVHQWRKASLMTERGMFDWYECARCGARGKRYGFDSLISTTKRVDPIFCKA